MPLATFPAVRGAKPENSTARATKIGDYRIAQPSRGQLALGRVGPVRNRIVGGVAARYGSAGPLKGAKARAEPVENLAFLDRVPVSY